MPTPYSGSPGEAGRSPRVRCCCFLRPPPDLPARVSIGRPRLLPGCPTAPTFYPVPVRQVRTSPPAASPPRLAATQLLSARGSPHRGPQRTFTPSINAMPGTQSKWRHAMRGAMIKGRKLLPDSIADRWTPAAIITAAADVLAKAVIPAAATDIVALARSAIAAGAYGVIAWSRVGTGNSKP